MSQRGGPSPAPRSPGPGNGSQPGSRAGSPSGSPRNALTVAQQGVGQFPPSLGFDPAKPEATQAERRHRRIDLPPEAFLTRPGDNRFTKRPGFNTQGKQIQVDVNQFRITHIDTRVPIHQYDVTFTGGPTNSRSAIVRKLWEHPTVKSALRKNGATWLYDGHKLAWSSALLPGGEVRVHVDLDEGSPRNKGNNKFILVVRKTTVIKMEALRFYLQGKMSWDNSVMECMNFLDHLLRQFPSENLLAIKRNFYRPDEVRKPLSRIVEVAKGTYASIRMTENINSGGLGLGINVDVANTAFWTGGMSLFQMLKEILPTESRALLGKSEIELAKALKPVRHNGTGDWVPSEPFKVLRRVSKVRFICPHQNKAGSTEKPKEYMVMRFLFDVRYGEEGATARTVMVKIGDKTMSVYDFFVEKYGIRLKYPHFPLIETTKAGSYFPAELCIVKPMQRYPFKLNSEETSSMIRFAVTRPKQRREHIMEGAKMLNWERDPYMAHFGLKIAPKFATTPACLLPNPDIQYANNKLDPGTTGRWDLRGKKFAIPNTVALRNWGFAIVEDRTVDVGQLTQFARQFKQVYVGHGGIVRSDPVVIDARSRNVAEALLKAYDQLRKNGPVDLMFVVLRAKNTESYERFKKSADCRLGILSQGVLAAHVIKNQGQYHSNVCMKVNSKLGGTTSIVNDKIKKGLFFKRPTMVLGVDISHSSPSIEAASVAAMVMSIDKYAARYAAAANSNGQRNEILLPMNTCSFFNQMLPVWKTCVGPPPQHIIYFRDGVAEGQFAAVLACEVAEMKRYFQNLNIPAPQFTVIIATKRHHIRFFPQQGDRNANPLPGTLVEREVTHPYFWDFYLCSHVAIQGTARPVHYHVILDEANCKPEELQRMIYSQCYQYARSTTPVSLHPAVYYAHLASNRARAHESTPSSEGPRSGSKAHEIYTAKIAQGDPIVSQMGKVGTMPLLTLGGEPNAQDTNRKFFRETMWYI